MYSLMDLYRRVRDNKYAVTMPHPFVECPCGERYPGHYYFSDNAPVCPKCQAYLGDAIRRFNELTAKYLAHKTDVWGRFKKDSLDTTKLTGHPKGETAWLFAIKQAGDEGQTEVLDCLVELSLLMIP